MVKKKLNGTQKKQGSAKKSSKKKVSRRKSKSSRKKSRKKSTPKKTHSSKKSRHKGISDDDEPSRKRKSSDWKGKSSKKKKKLSKGKKNKPICWKHAHRNLDEPKHRHPATSVDCLDSGISATSRMTKKVKKPKCYRIGGLMNMLWWYNVPDEMQSYKGIYKPEKIDVSYTGRDEVKRCLKAMEREKREIQRQGLWTERKHGMFWGILNTREFCQNKYWLKDEFHRSGQFKAAAKEAEELISFTAADNMGVRNELPYYYLLADELQKCFDFIVYWTNYEVCEWPSWDGVEKGCDIEAEFDDQKLENLHHAVCMTFLKYRLYNRERSKSHLKEQMEICFKRALELNISIWDCYINHKKHLANGLPSMSSPGTIQEAILSVNCGLPLYLSEAGFEDWVRSHIEAVMATDDIVNDPVMW